ncbi:MAG: hypothetical protein KC491_01140 [Dehalococcoidia bacterium]|nr:hypothetical protein [Dehalococcoidia bacterium]
MTQDLPGALLARDKLLAMAADPDLTGDAELFAFCLLAHLTEKRLTGRNNNWIEAVGEMMSPDADHGAWSCRRVIAKDIPRYEPPILKTRGCIALKSRGPNAGKPCGKGGSTWLDRDPSTGEARWLSYCPRHMPAGAHQSRQDRHRHWELNGKPMPPANTGGVLARYFSTNWAKMYAWADPHTEPSSTGKPATPPKPRLSVIRGGLS